VYGQTGAGKTHTMDAFTHLVLQQLYAAAARDDSNCEISITVSAVELYNEVLRCLLSGRENLQLRMGAGPGPGAASGVVLEGADERVSDAAGSCLQDTWLQDCRSMPKWTGSAASVYASVVVFACSIDQLNSMVRMSGLHQDGKQQAQGLVW
jgi:hypothetical protein